MNTQQTERELLRWLAGLVNDNFNDADTVTVDGETRTIGYLLDAANQALEPLTTDQQEDLDRSAAVPISADSASVLFGNFAAIEQAVEILHNKGYSSSVEGLNALWHELESLKNLHATAPLLSTIAQQGEALEAAQWRSMDSAPMDGTLVILYGDSFWTPGIVPTCPDLFNLVVQGHFSGGHWQIGGRTLEAKMWMPLPGAPVAALISQKVEG